MDKIKVAQIVGKGANGGVEAMMINLYRFMDRDKIQCDFLIEKETDIVNRKVVEALGGNLILVPSYKNPVKYIKALRRIFLRENYDIVHSNMNSLSVFTLYAAKKANIKIRIAHSHSTSNNKEFFKSFIKSVLKLFSKKYATDYLACGKLAGEWLFGEKAFNEGRVLVIENGVDKNRFKFDNVQRVDIRKKYHINDCFVLGTIGRMVEQKNQLFLLRVFKEVSDRIDNAKLIIVGDGPLKEQIIKLSFELKINDKLIIVENTSLPENFYNAFDLFLLPSLYEGLPVSGIEAQANGITCLFSKNISEEINISNNNVFLDIDDSCAWANAIVKIYNSNIYSRETNISDKFDIKNSALKLQKFYCKKFSNECEDRNEK